MRRYAGDDVRQVLVIGGFEAPRRLRRRARRADPGPTSVELTRATVIDATPLGELEAADAWLARATGDDRERVIGEALELLNRAVAGQRVASADPWLADADLTHALVCRVGYGTGEQVADGDWEAGVELPLPEPPRAALARALAAGAPGRAAQRPRRGARLRGADAARPRRPRSRARARGRAPARHRARHRARGAGEAWREQGDMGRRLDELDGRREAVAAAARAALAGGLDPERVADVASTLERLEAALRARQVASGE